MLVYLDAQDEKNLELKNFQFVFHADWLDLLRKSDKIKTAFQRKFPDCTLSEFTLDKNKKVREIKVTLVGKESGFKIL